MGYPHNKHSKPPLMMPSSDHGYVSPSSPQGCSRCGCSARYQPSDLIFETSMPPPPYSKETDAELRRAKPRCISTAEELLNLWMSLLLHLQHDEGRWLARGEAWLIKRTTTESERANPRLKPYLHAIEGRMGRSMQQHIEVAIVHREMCRRHQRSRCFCWSFPHGDEVVYVNFKALFEERRMEFY